MADQENTIMEVDKGKNKPFVEQVKALLDDATYRTDRRKSAEVKNQSAGSCSTAEYCEKLQAWMWQYYTGYVNWQSWLLASASAVPPCLQPPSGTSTALVFNPQIDVSKFAMHFIVEEIDEDTSMEELQKMMLVALVYRMLVCFYEIVCIWGAGGATPGKFLIGLRVVTCDSSVLVQPNRVLVVPATNVSLSASTVRALNKNFSIAFFFPAFITLLFFQHNRTVYDMVAGTIVVKRSRVR
ncbi:hypothetical protein GOODEAATRI_017989 [Goodea atripinnis]|uniref:RDD domain-containing protein n=1 Tax=Goodea atripinnis TaxID=208336 RepID=A0ABV0P5T4_9TELE